MGDISSLTRAASKDALPRRASRASKRREACCCELRIISKYSRQNLSLLHQQSGFRWRFSVAEAIADDIRVSLSFGECTQVLPVPLTDIPELVKPTATLTQLGKVWRSEECTFCGTSGKRNVRVSVD